MSRPKSQATLDREEKRRRKLLIKQTEDKKKAWKAERKRLKNLAKNAELKPKGLPQGSTPELIRYKPTLICSICHEIKRGDSPDRSADFVCEECLRKGGAEEEKNQKNIVSMGRLEGGNKENAYSPLLAQKNKGRGEKK